jgi:hypothetical protein
MRRMSTQGWGGQAHPPRPSAEKPDTANITGQEKFDQPRWMDQICLLMCAMRVAQTEQIGARPGERQYWHVSILNVAAIILGVHFSGSGKKRAADELRLPREIFPLGNSREIARASVRTQPLIRVGVVLLFMLSLCVAHIHGQGVSE